MDLWKTLYNRFDRRYLGARAVRQVQHVARILGAEGAMSRFHLEELHSVNRFIKWVLHVGGWQHRCVKNALQFKFTNHEIVLPGLNNEHDGLRVLHLSDLHLDGHPGFGTRLAEHLRSLEFDLVLITGDYRFRTTGPFDRVLAELQQLMPVLQCRFGVYGVLGNHDFIEMVPDMEKVGLKILINEAVNIGDSKNPLWVAGVDDAHYYGTHSIAQALTGIPFNDPVIIMVHSPELIETAYQYGCDLYLCGHTHAGQICLPGGIAIWTNAKCKRRYTSGPWQYEHMQGFTSAGTGSSGVFARFFCPPEVAIHVLKKRDSGVPQSK